MLPSARLSHHDGPLDCSSSRTVSAARLCRHEGPLDHTFHWSIGCETLSPGRAARPSLRTASAARFCRHDESSRPYLYLEHRLRDFVTTTGRSTVPPSGGNGCETLSPRRAGRPCVPDGISCGTWSQRWAARLYLSLEHRLRDSVVALGRKTVPVSGASAARLCRRTGSLDRTSLWSIGCETSPLHASAFHRMPSLASLQRAWNYGPPADLRNSTNCSTGLAERRDEPPQRARVLQRSVI